MKTIAIFIEERDGFVVPVGLELLSETRRIVGRNAKVVAVYLTAKVNSKNTDKISLAGPDEIIIAEHPLLGYYDTLHFTKVLSEIEKEYKFAVLLLGSTLLGRDLAPRLSARLLTGLTADATILNFVIDEEKVNLHATRPALGGNLFATILCPNTMPQMATIRPGVFNIATFDVKPVITNFSVTLSEHDLVKVIKREKVERQTIELAKAKIIVAGGRGVATNFSDIKTLAHKLGGEAAASRAVIDANIEAKERLVGQTGTNVKPAVYLAFGISGAIQHVSGMDKSELIIAVNSDPDALIFKVADASFVCDAKEVMTLLINEVDNLAKFAHQA